MAGFDARTDHVVCPECGVASNPRIQYAGLAWPGPRRAIIWATTPSLACLLLLFGPALQHPADRSESLSLFLGFAGLAAGVGAPIFVCTLHDPTFRATTTARLGTMAASWAILLLAVAVASFSWILIT